jgi:hypothetical protein
LPARRSTAAEGALGEFLGTDGERLPPKRLVDLEPDGPAT